MSVLCVLIGFQYRVNNFPLPSQLNSHFRGSSTKEESLVVVASMEHIIPPPTNISLPSRLFDYSTLDPALPAFYRLLSPPPRGSARSFTSSFKTDKIKVQSGHIIGKWSRGISMYVHRDLPGGGRGQELIRNGRTTVNYSSQPEPNPGQTLPSWISLLPPMASTPRKPHSFYSISPLSLHTSQWMSASAEHERERERSEKGCSHPEISGSKSAAETSVRAVERGL